MPAPINGFKADLATADTRYGMFVSLADPVCAEIAAGSDIDVIVIDTEHAPNDLRTTMLQLQAVGGYDTHVVVRPFEGDKALIKRLIDIGAQTLLVPMVETAEQAADVVAYTRYPPAGVRGVASARAAGWGAVEGYFGNANDEICVIVQIESQAGLDNLDAICAVDGVDAVFIGPSDLAAALGHVGNPGHDDVQTAVVGALEAIARNGKPAGVYGATPDAAARYVDVGAKLVLVAVDTMLLRNSINALVGRFT